MIAKSMGGWTHMSNNIYLQDNSEMSLIHKALAPKMIKQPGGYRDVRPTLVRSLKNEIQEYLMSGESKWKLPKPQLDNTLL